MEMRKSQLLAIARIARISLNLHAAKRQNSATFVAIDTQVDS
jgi:hypothetical protein